ncbi:MAG: lysophospholipid acyltransferase family protein [Kovacikia sp.]
MRANHSFQSRLGWSLDQRDPKVIQLLMPLWGWLYHHYFRVQTSGWHHIPSDGKVLFIGSHNGGIAAPDMFMMIYDWFRRFGLERPVYGLMHPQVWQASPAVSQLAVGVGAVMAHPKMAIAALRREASLLIYPGGAEDIFRPHHLRNKIHFCGRQAFIKIALREKVPIVPVVSHGAHDTLIVLADIYRVMQQLHTLGMPWLFGIDPVVFPIYLGLPWGVAIGPLPNIPLPVQIHTRVCSPIVFERYGQDAASDRAYVNACYETVCSQMQQELDYLIKQTQGTGMKTSA